MFQQIGQLGVFDRDGDWYRRGDSQTLAAGYADAIGVVSIQVYRTCPIMRSTTGWWAHRGIRLYLPTCGLPVE
jgi:hypothetical protein